MKKIKLTRGLVTQVDDEDYEYLNQWKWYASKNKSYYYVARTEWKGIHKKYFYMHRVIMNASKEIQIDHINHNTLNNQKYNLRLVTPSQNNMNRIAGGKSKYIGVSYAKGKYICAFIKVNGKTKYLGTFNTEEEAAKERDKASIKYFKEYALLNFK